MLAKPKSARGLKKRAMLCAVHLEQFACHRSFYRTITRMLRGITTTMWTAAMEAALLRRLPSPLATTICKQQKRNRQ